MVELVGKTLNQTALVKPEINCKQEIQIEMSVVILQTYTHKVWFAILHFTEVPLTARRH